MFALGAFDFGDKHRRVRETPQISRQPEFQARGSVGDPVDFSDEDAANLARTALMFGAYDDNEANNG